jgi:uncharacterized protein
MIDPLSLRERPSGWPVLHQRWQDLVLLHWRLTPGEVRSKVPEALELDLFDGTAWASVVAFTVTRMRPSLLPPIPGLSDAHQVNVRTYVRRDGVPGLWFFSLDADNALAVSAARWTYSLPYYGARMTVTRDDGAMMFRCERTDPRAPPATFDAAWTLGESLGSPKPETVDSFLLDRYVLYAGSGATLRARIHHRPWPLRRAALTRLSSTMLESVRVAHASEPSLIHAQAQPFDVAIWRPEHATKDVFC